MRQFRYYVYMTQEELDAETPTYVGSVTASNRYDANEKVNQMFPGSYYMYCLV